MATTSASILNLVARWRHLGEATSKDLRGWVIQGANLNRSSQFDSGECIDVSAKIEVERQRQRKKGQLQFAVGLFFLKMKNCRTVACVRVLTSGRIFPRTGGPNRQRKPAVPTRPPNCSVLTGAEQLWRIAGRVLRSRELFPKYASSQNTHAQDLSTVPHRCDSAVRLSLPFHAFYSLEYRPSVVQTAKLDRIASEL